MSLPDMIPAWLPGSFPCKRSKLPPHKTHAWAIEIMRLNRWFCENYEGADKRLVWEYFSQLMDDDFWNLWAEAQRELDRLG